MTARRARVPAATGGGDGAHARGEAGSSPGQGEESGDGADGVAEEHDGGDDGAATAAMTARRRREKIRQPFGVDFNRAKDLDDLGAGAMYL